MMFIYYFILKMSMKGVCMLICQYKIIFEMISVSNI